MSKRKVITLLLLFIGFFGMVVVIATAAPASSAAVVVAFLLWCVPLPRALQASHGTTATQLSKFDRVVSDLAAGFALGLIARIFLS